MFKSQNPEKMVSPIKSQINLCLQAQRKNKMCFLPFFFLLHCNSFILNLFSLLSYIFPIKEDIHTTKGYNLNPESHFQTTKKRRERKWTVWHSFSPITHTNSASDSFIFFSLCEAWSVVCAALTLRIHWIRNWLIRQSAQQSAGY